MDKSSFFWANFGVLEKIGVWTPFYDKSVDYGVRKKLYDYYKAVIFTFSSIHTFMEIIMITYGFRQLEPDELAVSVVYGIQHFLGLVKIYIMINRKYDFLELDRRTKMKPLYRKDDPKFLDNLERTVNWSRWIGYVYWFAVIQTISCGCATGVYVTLASKNEMVSSCQMKYELYETFVGRHQIDVEQVPWKLVENGSVFERHALKGQDEINDLAGRINFLEQKISEHKLTVPSAYELECERPKRVFPYHLWLPFSKYTRYYELIFALSFLIGFFFVLIILPIDLMIMSFMRYIRFQFYVIKDDLRNLRENVVNELRTIHNGHLDEKTITLRVNKRLQEIVDHHIAVFDFFYRADDLFTWVLFAQYLASGAQICSVLFSISAIADQMMTPKFSYLASSFSGLIIQLFTNCFYGSQVFVASENIHESAYFCGWEASGQYSTQVRKALTLIMMRSKNACCLTAGKFASVDLPTFLAVFKASYTYYTVLVDGNR